MEFADRNMIFSGTQSHRAARSVALVSGVPAGNATAADAGAVNAAGRTSPAMHGLEKLS